MAYDLLFSPMKIGNMTVKNRCVMTAAELALGQINGAATERMMDYYEARAKGGVGMIITGCCRIDDMNPASFTQLGMTHDYQIEPMREMVDRVHRHGAKLCVQLHHAGRQGYGCCNNTFPLIIPMTKAFPGLVGPLFKCAPVLLDLEMKKIGFSVQAPSKCELSKHAGTRIHAMSKREIRRCIQGFIDAAERCKKAGVDAVELHGAHGYLIQQFISPHTNLRTDEYGGSFDNRMRFLTEIIQGIRERCGRDYPLIVRISADEMYDRIGRPGVGYGLDTGIMIAKRLEELGVDAINVSSATYDAYNYWLETTSFKPGWRAYLAKEVKKAVSIPVIASNYVRSPEQAERQLEEGYQDFIGSARNYICDPEWAEKASQGRENEIRRCIGCVNCMNSLVTDGATKNKPAKCALNMALAHEREYANLPKDGNGRSVAVIGAGPAGLTAAQILAMRGFKVVVFEKAEKPGGQVITAASCNLKDKLYWCIEDLMTAVTKLGVEVRLNTPADSEAIKALNCCAVVLASGGNPVRPKSIAGIDRNNVFTAPEVIMRDKEISNARVVVVGSGITGLETAELLSHEGNKVTVVEMADTVAPGAWFQVVEDEFERIDLSRTEFRTSCALQSIEANGVTVRNTKTNENAFIPADAVVLSMGVKPDKALEESIKAIGVPTYIVGDAVKSGTIADACHSAYDVMKEIH